MEILLCPGCSHPLTCGHGWVECTPAGRRARTSLPSLAPPSIPPVAASSPPLSMEELFDEVEEKPAVSTPPVAAPPPTPPTPPAPPAPVRLRHSPVLQGPLARGFVAACAVSLAILILAGAAWVIARPVPSARVSEARREDRPRVIVEEILVVRRGTTARMEAEADPKLETRTANASSPSPAGP